MRYWFAIFLPVNIDFECSIGKPSSGSFLLRLTSKHFRFFPNGKQKFDYVKESKYVFTPDCIIYLWFSRKQLFVNTK